MPKQTVKVCVRTRPTANFADDCISINPGRASIDINTAAKKLADATHVDTSGINNAETLFRFNFHHVLHNASQDTVYNTGCNEVVQVRN